MKNIQINLVLLISFNFLIKIEAKSAAIPPSPKIIFPDDFDYNNCLVNNDPNSPGMCIKFEECPVALNEWKQSGKEPQHCFYEGFDQYVCCGGAIDTKANLNIDVETPDVSKRISQTRCRKFPWSKPEIAHGLPTEIGEYPYMAALGWRVPELNITNFLCGGVLISRNFVLSAAHCIDVNGKQPSVVYLGGASLNDYRTNTFNVKRTIIHPDYDSVGVYNDISLIELTDRTYDFNPACLWIKDDFSNPDVTAIGYGHIKFGGPGSKDLLKAPLKLVSNEECEKFYKKSGGSLNKGLQSSQICAVDDENKRDTCQGDSGGPILYKDTMNNIEYGFVVGITSFGQACGLKIPSVYTKVAHYIDWIEGIVFP